MKYFKWYGFDTYGKEHKGYAYGTSPAHVRSLLVEHNIAVLRVKPSIDFWRLFKKRVIHREIALFWHHMATLLSGGISLSLALHLVKIQLPGLYFKAIVQDVKRQIDEGAPLYSALAYHEDYFSETVVALIKASEHSGNLAQMCSSLSWYYENVAAYRQKLQAALFMPLITLIFSLFVIMGVFIGVVPQFEFFFQQQEHPLSSITKVVFFISSFLRSSWMPFFLVGGGGILGLIGMMVRKSVRMKVMLDTFYTRLPWVNRIIRLYSTLCFLQALHLLLIGGIPLIDALMLSRLAIKNSYFRQQCSEVCSALQEGLSLSKALQKIHNPFFPPQLISMASIAEESGKLTVMLEKTSILVAQDLTIILNRIINYIQPCLLCIVGLVVVGITLAIYLPLFSMMHVLA